MHLKNSGNFGQEKLFWSGKMGLQAVYTMCKGFQDLDHFLGVMFPTTFCSTLIVLTNRYEMLELST